jgi:hypothetical protein
VTADASAAIDAGQAPEAGGGAPGLPTSCDELAAGGNPDALVDFQWEWDPSCGQFMCWTTFRIENGCDITMQSGLNPNPKHQAATLSASECAAARAWVTNPSFLDVLRTGKGCTGGTLPEAFELTLKTEEPRFKTWGCAEPTVALERTCLHALIDQHFTP